MDLKNEKKYRNCHKNGFTLIEISIVVVIIGLIVGGILTGRDLIRAGEIRSTVSDIESFRSAFNTFRLKYNCMPGDCADATSYFGASVDCNAAGSGTCNGNGDNKYGYWYENEPYRAWQQLSLAGLVSGSFTGICTSGNVYRSIPGINVPKAHFESGAYSISGTIDGGWALTNFFANGVDNGKSSIILHRDSGINAPDSLLSAIDAMNIDTKSDDGLPGTGQTRSFYSGCVTTVVASTSVYNYWAGDTPNCMLLFGL
jgi:prepilin-type N-terminal cleavage/methylation domain-containing protein